MKSLFGYLAIGLIKLLGKVSLASAQKLGIRIGGYLLSRRSRSREVARVNLSLVYPEKSEAERAELLRNSLSESGKTLS